MPVEKLTIPTHKDIRLDLVSMNEWRVCDRRFEDGDSRAVLGHIQRNEFAYVVTPAVGPTASFGSLASATSSFSAVE